MSRARTRPTREQTKQRLIDAAVTVFERQGLAGSSIEDVCAEAGFTRGAFYSSFGTKNDLVLEVLDAMLDANLAEIERLYEISDSPEGFIESMESSERRRVGVASVGPRLYIELLFVALADPENRPRMVERQRRQHEVTKGMVVRLAEASGRQLPGSADDIASLIMAFDDGLSIHQLVDPDGYRPGQFADTMLMLNQLWLGRK